MQSRRGFFQTLLAGAASTLAKSPATPTIATRVPADFMRTQMQAEGYYRRIMTPVSRCEMGTVIGAQHGSR